MGTIYQFIQLKKIEFQSDSKEVLISCEILKNMEVSVHYFVVSHTELNKIISDLQRNNEELDIYEFIEQINLTNSTSIYSLDLEKNNLLNSWLPELNFTEKYKEIRA